MPEKETIERARRDRRQGKAPSTQAGEFVREEIEHVREGKHGARSTKQAIAIGLSKAPRAGYATTGGRRSAHGAADSKAAAARSTVASSRQGPASWSPTGSPSRVKPHGIEIAGRPTTVKA